MPSFNTEVYNSIFQPSFSTKCVSELAAPRTLLFCGTLGACLLGNISLSAAALAAGVAVAAKEVFTKIIFGGYALRPAVFLEAEHLSKRIPGGMLSITVPLVLEALDKAPFQDAQSAKNCLEGLLNYEKTFNLLGLGNGPLIADVLKHIHCLRPGQTMALPFNVFSVKGDAHAMIGSIERKITGQFIVRIHDGGRGGDYTYEKYDRETGNLLYQTVLEIDEVDEKNLVHFIQETLSFGSLHWESFVSKIYKSIPLLQGRILPPISDSRAWLRSQEDYSCSGYVIRCFLQRILTPESFSEFEKQLRTLSIKKLKDGIERGWFWENTPEHYRAHEELRAKSLRLKEPDPGVIRREQPPLLTRMASKIQKSFWKMLFHSFEDKDRQSKNKDLVQRGWRFPLSGLQNPIAQQLAQVVKLLRQNNIQEAKSILYKIYPKVKALGPLSRELAEEYAFVVQCMWDLDSPYQLEAIELYAAVTWIFRLLRQKEIVHHRSLSDSEYLGEFIRLYCAFRLDREFPDSPWSQDLRTFYLQSDHPPTFFEPIQQWGTLVLIGMVERARRNDLHYGFNCRPERARNAG